MAANHASGPRGRGCSKVVWCSLGSFADELHDADSTLNTLTQQLTQSRIDLIHFPIVYYFSTLDEEASLPNGCPHSSDSHVKGLKSAARRACVLPPMRSM